MFKKEQDKAPYTGKIRTLVPFDELSNQAQNEIIQIGKVFKFKKRDVVFKQGDRDTYSFYLLEGEIEMLADKEVKSTIVGGTDSARYAMARLLPRQFTARARDDCLVLQLDKATVDRIMVADKEDRTDITSSRHYEVSEIGGNDDIDWMTRMLQSEIFSSLPTANIQQLFVMLEPKDFKSGDTVIKQGDPGDSYYIIQEGRCEVSRLPSSGSKPVKLAELMAGDSFGEEALLTDGKRNASVTMLTDGTLMRLSKENFINLIKIPSMNEVTFSQGKGLVEVGGVWLDVRFKDEFQESNIKGSINIPFSTLRAQLEKLDKGKHYVVCCDSGGRSSAAAFTMLNHGFNVSILKGGMSSALGESMTTEKPAAAGPVPEKRKPEAAPKQKSKPATSRPEPASKETDLPEDDPEIRNTVLGMDMSLNEMKLEQTSQRLAEAADDTDTTEIRRKKKELEEQRKKLAVEKKKAELEARKFREQEARKIAKLKQDTEKRLAAEKKKLEEIYTKNTEEMEKIEKMKLEAEEQLRREREKLEREAAKARDIKETEASRKALDEEAAKKRELQDSMEKEVQARAKATLEAERRKLAEEFAKANAAMDKANRENAMSEAARKAAAEEAKSIIEEYKKQFEEERARERAKLEQEKKQLEQESSKIKKVLKEIEQTKKEAEATKAAAALEAQKLRAAQTDALDEKAKLESEAQIKAAELKLRQAEKNLENVEQAKANMQSTAEINRKEITLQMAKNEALEQQVASDLADFLDEQNKEENKHSRVISHSDHVKRIKERAEAAKKAAQKATDNLFADIESQLGKDD